MKKFTNNNWKDYLPQPVCDEFPEYQKLYSKAWELAHTHIKDIKGMPQNPYMDEGFCDTQVWIWDTCFMALFCKYAQTVFPGKESFKNFYEVLYNGRQLPEIMPTENEPSWTGAKPGVSKWKAVNTGVPSAKLNLTVNDDGTIDGQIVQNGLMLIVR